jgi:hypothetical protein
MTSIEPYDHIDGSHFGDPSSTVLARLGTPERRRVNRSGEDELCYPDTIWRFRDDRLVECTIKLTTPVNVRGQKVESFRAWLPSVDPKATSNHGFLVSQDLGIAVDLDDDHFEYVTIFEQGRWDIEK